jgi:hypothetical protein
MADLEYGTLSRRWSCHLMKQPEYIEGPEARKRFERGMIALFKAPKPAIGEERKKGRKLTTARRKKKSADKG